MVSGLRGLGVWGFGTPTEETPAGDDQSRGTTADDSGCGNASGSSATGTRRPRGTLENNPQKVQMKTSASNTEHPAWLPFLLSSTLLAVLRVPLWIRAPITIPARATNVWSWRLCRTCSRYCSARAQSLPPRRNHRINSNP